MPVPVEEEKKSGVLPGEKRAREVTMSTDTGKEGAATESTEDKSPEKKFARPTVVEEKIEAKVAEAKVAETEAAESKSPEKKFAKPAAIEGSGKTSGQQIEAKVAETVEGMLATAAESKEEKEAEVTADPKVVPEAAEAMTDDSTEAAEVAKVECPAPAEEEEAKNGAPSAKETPPHDTPMSEEEKQPQPKVEKPDAAMSEEEMPPQPKVEKAIPEQMSEEEKKPEPKIEKAIVEQTSEKEEGKQPQPKVDKAILEPEAKWTSPLAGRYLRGSPLLELFSERRKIETWRRLWVYLAKAEVELGLGQITEKQVLEMEENVENIDWEFARFDEAETRHDVMAHIHTFEKAAPGAAGVIHLGATSAYVQDNADLIVIRKAIDHALDRIAVCLQRFSALIEKYKAFPMIGRTHYQPASLVTVGKRLCLYAEDLLMAFQTLKGVRMGLRFRGIKGATGTFDSFLNLFKGDKEKVKALNRRITELAWTSDSKDSAGGGSFIVTGQTYPRMQDADVYFALAKVASAINRFCTDLRILQAFGEMKEPFESTQIGSSAMPYKRNPMRSERCCAMARFLMSLERNGLDTAACNGMERTLDDSANRRLAIPEAFLTLEALLMTVQNILEDLVIKEERINASVQEELPFLALESILMKLTELGASRQVAHEKIRKVSLVAKAKQTKGEKVCLRTIVGDDPFFKPVHGCIDEVVAEPKKLTGMSADVVEEFLEEELMPAIAPHQKFFRERASLAV